MKHGSLFSGIGGFELAAQWMGWDNVFSVEFDPFCQTILNHHFPNSIKHGNIYDFDASAFQGQIDIITGGFPCQPFSIAGKQKGTDDKRYLWPQMFRVIREIGPTWVVAENVRGFINWSDGLVFDTVCADLEGEGFEVFPTVLPACGVDAPHRRERVWVVAHRDNTGSGNAMRTDSERTEGVGERLKEFEFGTQSLNGVVANSKHDGHVATQGRGSDGTDCQRCKEGEEVTEQLEGICEPQELGTLHRNASDTDDGRRPLETVQTRREEFAGGTWSNFPTQSPVCGGNDGIPDELDGITFSKWRNKSIKAYGNAIVPQVAFELFKAIQKSMG